MRKKSTKSFNKWRTIKWRWKESNGSIEWLEVLSSCKQVTLVKDDEHGGVSLRGQFRQHFTREFYVRIFCQSQNVTRIAAKTSYSYEKFVRLTLMKLTPEWFVFFRGRLTILHSQGQNRIKCGQLKSSCLLVVLHQWRHAILDNFTPPPSIWHASKYLFSKYCRQLTPTPLTLWRHLWRSHCIFPS